MAEQDDDWQAPDDDEDFAKPVQVKRQRMETRSESKAAKRFESGESEHAALVASSVDIRYSRSRDLNPNDGSFAEDENGFQSIRVAPYRSYFSNVSSMFLLEGFFKKEHLKTMLLWKRPWPRVTRIVTQFGRQPDASSNMSKLFVFGA